MSGPDPKTEQGGAPCADPGGGARSAALLAGLVRLHPFPGSLDGSPALPRILRESLAATVELLDGAQGELVLFDPGSGVLRTAASLELSDEYVRRFGRVPPGAGAAGAAFAGGRTVVVAQLEGAAAYAAHAAAAGAAGYRAAVGVPLLDRGGRAIGALAIYFPRPCAPSAPEIRQVELYARMAGLALDGARSRGPAGGEGEGEGEGMAALQTIVAALGSAPTEREAVAAVAERGGEALGASALAVLALADGGNVLEVVHAVGWPQEAKRYRLPLSDDSLVAAAVRAAEPTFLPSLEGYSAHDPHLRPLRGASVGGFGGTSGGTSDGASDGGGASGAGAAVPLRARGQVVGALAIVFEAPGEFTAEERAFIATLGHLAGQALERARVHAAAQEARQEAERAKRAKGQFLAVMSHELRTPLNAVIGYTDLLEGEIVGPVTERQREHLARVKTSAGHLRELIDQVLSLARIEAGRKDLHRVRIDVAELARETVALIEPLATKRRLRLRLQAPDAPLHLETDAAKLRQILLNLLSNAVKFTDQGGVDLVVQEEGETVLLHVRDTGVGIAPDHLERIFEPFTQVDPSPTRRHGGSGLGLSVSRHLARLLGGDLAVESAPGVGSTFTVRLPLRLPLPAQSG